VGPRVSEENGGARQSIPFQPFCPPPTRERDEDNGDQGLSLSSYPPRRLPLLSSAFLTRTQSKRQTTVALRPTSPPPDPRRLPAGWRWWAGREICWWRGSRGWCGRGRSSGASPAARTTTMRATTARSPSSAPQSLASPSRPTPSSLAAPGNGQSGAWSASPFISGNGNALGD